MHLLLPGTWRHSQPETTLNWLVAWKYPSPQAVWILHPNNTESQLHLPITRDTFCPHLLPPLASKTKAKKMSCGIGSLFEWWCHLSGWRRKGLWSDFPLCRTLRFTAHPHVAPETVVLGHPQKQQDKKMRHRSVYELAPAWSPSPGSHSQTLWPSTSLKVLFLLYQNH